jgi:hypothetical protein
MPTSYTTSLGLALPADNELGGTWGQVVNAFITTYLDAAIAGAQTISGSQTAVTLTKTTGLTLSQAGVTSTGSAQYSIINCTGNPASLLTITAPAASKVYLVINLTSTLQQVKIVGAGPTTGVTLISGERALVAWNGSDFVKVASSIVSGLTANRLLYGSAVGEIAQSAGLTFDGTNFATTGTASATKIIPTGGTAAGNGMYLPSANTIAISTNSLESLRIDGAGALTVRGPTVTTSIVFNDPILGATNNYIYLPSANTIAIRTNGVDAITISSTGATTVSSLTINDGYTEEVFTVSGTTPALSPTNGSIQTWTLSGASTPTAGTWASGQSLTLMVDDGTAFTINWASVAVTWKTNNGIAPTLNTTGFTVIQLWKVGTTIYGARVGDA